jgi:integrase
VLPIGKAAMRIILKDVPFRFTIKHPTSRRAAFGIEKRRYQQKPQKVLSSEAVDHPILDTINENLKAGKIDRETALKNVLDLREQLYREAGATQAVVHNAENRQLLERYWKAEYQHRELVDPQTARYELERAIEALGMHSIYSATQEEIQTVIDKFKGNKQRRIAAKLSILIRFAGRTDVRLRKAKKEKKRVKTLTEPDFVTILSHLPTSVITLLHRVAFYTGARIGECFAMTEADFDEDKLELKIYSQIDKVGVERGTKNRSERVTLVFPAGVSALKAWFAAKSEVTPEQRKRMARYTRAACQAVFKDPAKHLVFHDLRHCYARMIREKGLTTEDVADLIGDNLIVAKEHYTNFGPTDGIMDLRRQAIRKKPRKAA